MGGLNNQLMDNSPLKNLSADCKNCFGLCCVALPYARSADFPIDKEGGVPCRNLESNNQCGIYQNLRTSGFKGCTVYECFGAGQKVSQLLYKGKDWRDHPESALEMFAVLPVMHQLHEILYYLQEALLRDEASPIYQELQQAFTETELLTNQSPAAILEVDIPSHRANVNKLLLQTSDLVRSKVKKKKSNKKQLQLMKRNDLIGEKLSRRDLKGTSVRGKLLLGSDLREADLRWCDFIGADMRDADIGDADLSGSIFLTQSQVNASNGNSDTKLPGHLAVPKHWCI